jgi:CheY-like chemotaxis protein
MPHALVAEDEPLLRMDVADMLSEAGFTVLEAPDGLTALDRLQEHGTVGLLFTDIDMPGAMDGIERAREAARRWPAMTIIVCSGCVTPPAGSLPAHARFISKPYNPNLIRQLLTAM